MKALKYLIVTVITIVVLAILTLVGVALFVNPNHFKAQIINEVDKVTGRHLTINGNIRWSFFPWLGLGVQDVSLSNAPGFGQEPFASLGEMDVSVKFLPLLHGSVNIGTVKLTNLQMNLVKQTNGKTNWDDLMAMGSQGALPSPQTASAQSTVASNAPTSVDKNKLAQMVVSQIIINNAKISWQNQQKNVQKLIIIDSLKADNLNNQGETAGLFMSVRITSPNNQQAYDLNLSTSGKYNEATQKINVSKFMVGLNNLEVNGNFQISQLNNNPHYDVTFNMPKTDVTKWLNSIGESIAFKDSSALRNVSINGHIQGDNNHVNISNLSAMVDGSAINLKLNMSNIKNLVGTFNLNADTLDFDKYTPISLPTNKPTTNGAVATKPAVPAVTNDGTSTKIPDSLLTGHITVGNIIANKFTMSQINADLSFKNRKLTLSPLSANFYGGQLAGTFGIDFSGKTKAYSANETLTGASLANILQAFTGKTSITGTLNLNANITTRGDDILGILNTLNGTGGLAIQSGQLPGLHITQALLSAASSVLKLPSSNNGNGGTNFSNLSATFVINQGILQSNNLVLNSSLFTVAGTGNIDLITQKLDWSIKINPTPSSIPQVQQLTKAVGGVIPLQVSGTLDDPSVTPDVSSIAVSVGKNQLNTGIQQIGDQINKGGKDLGKTIQNIFK